VAIDTIYMEFLRPVLKKIPAGKRVACLSYPDLLFDSLEISAHFPGILPNLLRVQGDGDRIKRWHGIESKKELVDTQSFFEALGLAVDFFDFKKFRGIEIETDFNNPIEEKYKSTYVLVLDTGTLEHCFNVGLAFINMCSLVKDGGIVLTAAPLNKGNHGFWNFSPCAYENFFRQNGWGILLAEGIYRDGAEIKRFSPPGNGRFNPPPESVMLVLARRKGNSSLKFPIQQKYVDLQ